MHEIYEEVVNLMAEYHILDRNVVLQGGCLIGSLCGPVYLALRDRVEHAFLITLTLAVALSYPVFIVINDVKARSEMNQWLAEQKTQSVQSPINREPRPPIPEYLPQPHGSGPVPEAFL